MHHAPLQRRSAGNLLQKLGLDRLDQAEGVRELVENAHELLGRVPAERVKDALEWQRRLFQQLSQGTPAGLIDPEPPPIVPPRRRKPRPR